VLRRHAGGTAAWRCAEFEPEAPSAGSRLMPRVSAVLLRLGAIRCGLVRMSSSRLMRASTSEGNKWV